MILIYNISALQTLHQLDGHFQFGDSFIFIRLFGLVIAFHVYLENLEADTIFTHEIFFTLVYLLQLFQISFQILDGMFE